MMYPGDGWIRGHGWDWGGWALMPDLAIAFLAACVIAIVLSVRNLIAPRDASGRPAGYAQSRWESSRAERFAHREVGADGYRRRVTVLSKHC